MKTIIEPFRIKSVEPIRMTSVSEREALLKQANYNLFSLKSDDVLIDLLTDSGTSAMSTKQWAGIQMGDESYAGSPSFYRFEQALKELAPFKHIIPTHQGRAAEKILFSILESAQSTDSSKTQIIPNNTHFDTTRANIEATGSQALDLVTKQGLDPELELPFKGDMDLMRLRDLLETQGDQVPIVMLTITNNSGGGQPVSMENIRQTKALCDEFNKPLFLDACRFAENAYFIKQREAGYQDKTPKEIVQEIFSYADGMTMSAKKDALVNMGGWLALNDDNLAMKARNVLILTEGFPTYGGLSGRDLEAMAVGLEEIVEEDYLNYRISSTAYFGDALDKLGIPIVKPVGGHAVYIDARAMLPHISPNDYPGQALAIEMYRLGGIRGCEIGTVMFGQQVDGSEKLAAMDLVRMAIPRRVYTQSHIDYCIECLAEVNKNKEKLRGVDISWQPPMLRHFTCHFTPK
ncbi:tryptophanase [Litorilituus lipolyticus]|uniref:Tryptophanase n=1 Tax=Litorilituus lipolyticus TaxID=2491017 RepID=A0A502L2N8_9GAMM|nr:tryptophanase [Litorilituus lipolyticus]TPH14627.1 tryptophanase [Litorilituus lipolyticus]